MKPTYKKMGKDVPTIVFDAPPIEGGPLRRGGGRDGQLVVDLSAEKDNSTRTLIKGGILPPRMLITFFLMVVLPSIAALFYFVILASDQYVAEARFAVRSLADDAAKENIDTGMMSMQSASQDAHVVTSFIHSSEILRRLKGKIDYRAMFTQPSADFWARFDPTDSDEAFLEYWSNHVSAYIDGPSGIVTLTVRTFREADAATLASAIVEESEKLVNELTVRARNDMLASFQSEVERNAKRYQDALGALTGFQQRSGLLSPADQAQETGKLLTGLLTQKLDLESRLFVLQQSNGIDSPGYRQLVLVRRSLDQQIDEMRDRLTGNDNSSLAAVITDFAELETERLVAEKLYESSRRNYDLALAAALRKGLYLTVFVSPAVPQEALYPRRLMSPLLISLGFLVMWSTISLAWASVEDHRL